MEVYTNQYKVNVAQDQKKFANKNSNNKQFGIGFKCPSPRRPNGQIFVWNLYFTSEIRDFLSRARPKVAPSQRTGPGRCQFCSWPRIRVTLANDFGRRINAESAHFH